MGLESSITGVLQKKVNLDTETDTHTEKLTGGQCGATGRIPLMSSGGQERSEQFSLTVFRRMQPADTWIPDA